jgi:hypothetical protein
MTKVICEEFGDKVKIIDVPFSPRGHDDTVAVAGFRETIGYSLAPLLKYQHI